MNRRVGIIALLQESNSFIAQPTTMRHFEQELLATGPAVRAALETAHHEVGGFFAGLAAHGVEAVPIFAARAFPSGVMTADTFEQLMAALEHAVREAGPLDGVLVAPHGATVSQNVADVDGYWLTRLRELVGPQTPLVGTFDPHGNLSAAMVAATDALIAYRTNPHVDQRQRGIDAAEIMARTLAGEIRPVQAATFPPLAINIECQKTDEEPCLAVYNAADRLWQRPGVLAVSIALGFPYADVPEMGAATVVVTDGDRSQAAALSQELAGTLWDARHTFQLRAVSIDDALAQAQQFEERVCLLDMGDNVGGGSPADSTFLAHALHAKHVPDAFISLCDPEAVAQALAAGVGADVTLAIGGKADTQHGAPLVARFTVVSRHEGKFSESEARHGGFTHFNQGPTVILRSEYGLTVMLTSERMAPWSLEQLRRNGCDPQAFHILVAKGVHSPVAAYRDICPHTLRVNTRGSTSADLSQFEYRHRRRPMYPWEENTVWPGAGDQRG